MEGRKIERVFLTGGAGFIGSAVLHHLYKQNADICCLVHKSPLAINSPKIHETKSDLVNFNWEELENYKPDAIYHFARISGKTKSERRKAAAQNALANTRLIEWMKHQDHPPLLIFGSGTLVYGNHRDNWVDESTKINPISFQQEYFEAEKPILHALEQSNLPVIIVRPPWIYGSGSWFEWFFGKHMKQKQAVPQYGGGSNYMSLIHIEDCAGLIHHIGKYGECSQVYNITGHPPISQFQFVQLLHGLSGLPIKKYSRIRLWWQFDKAARDALTFSLKSITRHGQLLSRYQFKYPEILPGLRSTLKELGKNKDLTKVNSAKGIPRANLID